MARYRKFRKLPVVIEAVPVSELLATGPHWDGLPSWLVAAYDAGIVKLLPDEVVISTLEGAMSGDSGSWIIQGVTGELYPCAGHIFEATYEVVD